MRSKLITGATGFFFIILLFAALILFFSGCTNGLGNGSAMKADGSAKRTMAKRGESANLVTPLEKRSYALGMDFGTRLLYQTVVIDEDIFMQGLMDARSGSETLLTQREVRDVLLKLQKDLKMKRSELPISSPHEVSNIHVAFKLDTRLTRGMYMGDRWVSPPTYNKVGTGKVVTVEARVQVLDDKGRRLNMHPEWVPADPGMVSVTPVQDSTVNITVKRTGESLLEVVSGKLRKELRIKGMERGNAMQVEISQ